MNAKTTIGGRGVLEWFEVQKQACDITHDMCYNTVEIVDFDVGSFDVKRGGKNGELVDLFNSRSGRWYEPWIHGRYQTGHDSNQ